MKRWPFIIYALVMAACQSPVVLRQETREPAEKTEVVKTIPVVHDTISIAAVGDIMLGSSYPDSNNLPPDSAKQSFAAVLKELRNADVTFGNLEGTLLDTSRHTTLKKKILKPYFFRMPSYYGKVLKDAGFDMVSLANNHIDDFGATGRNSTTHTLDSIGLQYAGLQSKPTTIFKSNGVTFGFCAFAPNSNTVSILDLKNVSSVVSELKKQVDIVIVSFHGGGEGVDFEHVPFNAEWYLGQARGDVHAFAHTAIDAGADVVFGNGPHVTRAMERYHNRLIAYSLGNFCTYKSVSVAGVCGIAPLLKVSLNKKGEFLSGRIIAVQQSHLTGLQRDTTNKVITRMQMLTRADFPQSGLSIADNGIILPVLN
jgi:hypothetical protein